MEFRRKLIAAAAMALLAGSAIPAYAVTTQEMDHARAIAAQWYLRWSNNGSDYLDELKPASMSELESKLKAKEKENIKAFKSVAQPSDYASWDKAKLVEYWSSTFFASEGLNEQGRGARSRVKRDVEALSIAAPAADPASTSTTAAPEAAPSATQGAESAPAPDPAIPSASEIIDETTTADSIQGAELLPEETTSKSSGSSSTWIYVVALIALIGVVVWLVIFASRTMQSQSGDDSDRDSRRDSDRKSRDPRPVPDADPADDSADDRVYAAAPAASGEKTLREKFVRTLASKDEEIRQLHREINDLRDECMRLGEENGRLTSDLTMAQREAESLRGRLRAASAVASAASSSPTVDLTAAPRRKSRTDAEPRVRKEGESRQREIY
ncbi:MAG: hypothetical protein K2I48_04220, partial [Muribaculaceae bacterium]|nr:hypothetical protein [Muribaculaceae bacterium]